MTATATKVHPFEEAGLGVAPFAFAAYSESKFQAAPGEPIRPGSSCDFCGTAIMGVFWVRSSDGRKFKVGCDCIRRTWAEFDRTIPPEFRRAIADVEYDKREAKRLAKWEKLSGRIWSANALLEEHPTMLTERPHPHAGLAASGKTLRDYYEWMLKNGGDSGKTTACIAIERAVTALASEAAS